MSTAIRIDWRRVIKMVDEEEEKEKGGVLQSFRPMFELFIVVFYLYFLVAAAVHYGYYDNTLEAIYHLAWAIILYLNMKYVK